MSDTDMHSVETRPLFVIGFTGTQRGMTDLQKKVIHFIVSHYLIQSVYPAFPYRDVVGLHGDCIGADADFNEVCVSLGRPRYCRPCTIEKKRAFTDAFQVADPVAPMVRNGIIVQKATLMLATPGEVTEQRRSGTWATIRRARKANKPLTIIFPDGSIKDEGAYAEAVSLRMRPVRSDSFRQEA